MNKPTSTRKAKKILVVDDDLQSVKYHVLSLQRAGFDVTSVDSVDKALDAAQKSGFDLVVVDVIMPYARNVGGLVPANDGRGGLHLAAAIRRQSRRCKILGFTNSTDEEVFEWFRGDPGSAIVRKMATMPDRFLTVVASLLEGSKPQPRVFIVHGRDREALLDLKNFLQNSLRLPEPIVLGEMGSRGRTVIEKLEHYASQIDFAFVLLTPDDLGGLSGSEDPLKARARQNVVFELGYFLGKLDRRSGQVVVLHKGPIEIASDLAGIVYVDIRNGVTSAGEEIRRELEGWL